MLLAQFELKNKPTTIKMKDNFVIYCRKSTESEEKQLQSIEDQQHILESLASERGLSILKVFIEEKSAKAPGRPIFNEMLDFIKDRTDIKGIMAWKLNRLSRNPVDSGTLQWLIQSKVIDEIVTPSKIYLDADSDFIMSIEGAQANRYIRDLREDTIRGINSKIEKGWKPGLAPVGYRNQVEKPKGSRGIEPHPIYFPLVRKLFTLALTKQYTLDGLGLEAQRLGLVTSKGIIRDRNNIAKLLSNPFYAGRFLYNGVLHVGSQERMVSDKEFDLVQKYISSRAKGSKNLYPISGFINCSCGYLITGSTRKKTLVSGKQSLFTYYRCSSHVAGKCNQPPIAHRELEEQVTDFLKTIKLSPKLVKWAIEQLNKDNKNQIQTKQAQVLLLNKNLESIKKKLLNLFNLKVDPENIEGSLITTDEYKEMRQHLLIKRADIEEELKKSDSLVNDWMDIAIKTFDFASKALEVWENGNLEKRRIILHAIGAKIELDNKILKITPRSMFLKLQNALKNSAGTNNLSVSALVDDILNSIPNLGFEEINIYRSLNL